MSDKIVVPAEMVKVAHKRLLGDLSRNLQDSIECILEAALRWLSDELGTSSFRLTVDNVYAARKDRGKFPCDDAYCIAVESVRRMFLAPKPEVDRVDFYIKTPDGEYRPWKPNEAQDEMRKYFDTAFGRFEIDDRVPPGEIRLHNWNGPTLLKVDAREPEVPEEIKGMQGIHLGSVKDQADLDRLVTELNVEAYRRGKESGK